MALTGKYSDMTPHELWLELIGLHSSHTFFNMIDRINDLTGALIAKDPQMGFLNFVNFMYADKWLQCVMAFFKLADEPNLSHLVDAGYPITRELRSVVTRTQSYYKYGIGHDICGWRQRMIAIDQFLWAHGFAPTKEDMWTAILYCCPQEVRFLVDELGWPVTDDTWHEVMHPGIHCKDQLIDVLLSTGFVPSLPYKNVRDYETMICVQDHLGVPCRPCDLTFAPIADGEAAKFGAHFGADFTASAVKP